MKMETWKIKPTGLSGWHLGRQSIEQEHSSVIFSSDSLFSALVAVLADMEGSQAVADFIQPFVAGSPPFVLTSAFPYAGSVRFYPTPQCSLAPADERLAASEPKAKDLKKVKYVSEGVLQQLLSSGQSLAVFYKQELVYSGMLVLPAEESSLPAAVKNREASIWKVEETARVTIDRANNGSTLFFTGAVHFASDCGLWFGVRWQDDASQQTHEQLKNLLDALSAQGLGGDRTSGYGQVHICRWDDVTTWHTAAGRRWLNLGRYLPQEAEISALTDPLAVYQLEQVGGWLQSPGNKAERRRTVNMVREGSVLGALPSEPVGDVVDVRPVYVHASDPFNHCVYRSGLAFGIGFDQGDRK